MSITVLDCALAVKVIYKNATVPGYNLLYGFIDPKNSAVGNEGFSIGLYQNLGMGSEYLVSIRGSAKSFYTKDWRDDDLSIGLGTLPDRTNDCLHFMVRQQQINPGASYLLTGHSLGGHIAQVMGVFCGLPFVTFNAPPALSMFRKRLPGGHVGGANFKMGLNYRVNYDPVSKTAGSHVGPLVVLPLAGQEHGKAHGATTVIASVQASGWGDRPARTEILRYNR